MAQEVSDVEIIRSGDVEIVPISYDLPATSTDVLISPNPESTKVKQEDTETKKDQDFLNQCSLLKCRVPIPTLKSPENKTFSKEQKIYLTGLTWNDTIISVYIDEKYVGQAVVRNDKTSNTANFYLELDNGFDSGEHRWSVIAWSLNNRDRSMISKENIFIIGSKLVGDVNKEVISDNIKDDVNKEATSSISEEASIINVVSPEQDTAVSISGDVSEVGVNVTSSEEKNMLVVDNTKKKSEEQINKSQDTEILQEATVSQEQQQEIQKDIDINSVKDTTDRNKKIGAFLLVALIFVVVLSGVVFKKKKA